MSIQNFETIWENVIEYVKRHSEIETLSDRPSINDIVEVGDDRIVVIPKNPRKELKERKLTKKDFRYAWNILVSKQSLFFT